MEQEPCLSKPCYHASIPQMKQWPGDNTDWVLRLLHWFSCTILLEIFPPHTALDCCVFYSSEHGLVISCLAQEHQRAYITCIMLNLAMPSRVNRRQFSLCWRFLSITVFWWSGFIIFMPPFLFNRLTTVRGVCLHQPLCRCLFAWSALKRDERACCHCMRE